MKPHLFILLLFILDSTNSQDVSTYNTDLRLNIFREGNKYSLYLFDKLKLRATGELALGLNISSAEKCKGLERCLKFEDVFLHVLDSPNGFTLLWTTTNTSRVLKDCYFLNKTNTNWFGGPERFYQEWPIEKLTLKNFANVLQEDNFSAIAEPYWLNSHGVSYFVDRRTPLFIDQNSYKDDYVCFIAKQEKPYRGRTRILLQYTISSLPNPRAAHLHAVQHFLGKPNGKPNINMIKYPVWSTWARYKRDVNDSLCINFANEILNNGFNNGQFELDDDWETCYGSLTFKNNTFKNITNTVEAIKSKGFRFTLWVHPFVNTDCKEYSEIGKANEFFVKNENGSILTQWWNSKFAEAQLLDFSKLEVRNWFTVRLTKIREDHGIESFKFDAGETSWAPQISILQGDAQLAPNSMSMDYVRTCAQFGDLVEVRSGYNTQDLPIFVRMIDKDSTWGHNNGLYTLITTLLQMNMNGYTMVLPDMVGGNGYNEPPTAELFVRWLQANTFMPSIQFSYVPWDYKNATKMDVLSISKKFVALHEKFADVISSAMENSIKFGHPVNGPIWWIDPENTKAHPIDTQYLLGSDVVVAPILEENSISRDIYLPIGDWLDGNTGILHHGPKDIANYSAPIDVLPYFVRSQSFASSLL